MSSFALPLALFEGTSWQMLVTSSVHEGRAKVDLDSSLPILKVIPTSAQDHDVLMAARIGPDFGELARLSAHPGHGISTSSRSDQGTPGKAKSSCNVGAYALEMRI